MKYYIIAGEASGDLHGGNLIREVRALDPAAEIRAWGGDHMEAAGSVLVKHYRELAFMGFLEVVVNLRTILRNMRMCKEDILRFNPDVVVFIDYPGFNIPISGFAKSKGFKTVYYISPQVWAWKEGRVQKIKKYIDRMLVILPFEKDFYKKWRYEVEYVGHPLMEEVEKRKSSHASGQLTTNFTEQEAKNKVIALLPGSRRQEVRMKLPLMLGMVNCFPDCEFVVAQAPGLDDAFIQSFLKPGMRVSVRKGDTYGLLQEADAALVTSGTATLETALFNVPQVVCYKGNALSYLIAKQLVKIKYISLVNLIMNREVVKELIQDDLNTENLKRELSKLLQPENISRIKGDYRELQQQLQSEGSASAKAARIIVDLGNGVKN